MLTLDYDTWMMSDTHWFHKNIIKFCNREKDDLDKFMLAWKELIKPEDIVFHLGDLFMGMGSENKAKSLLPGLKGKKYFLRGNHDHQSTEWYAMYDWTEVGEKSRLYQDFNGKRVLFSHYPDCTNFDWDINIHGHVHNGGYAPGTPMKLDYRNISFEILKRPVRLREVLDGDAFQRRCNAPGWPLSKIWEMDQGGRLTASFCEIERY